MSNWVAKRGVAATLLSAGLLASTPAWATRSIVVDAYAQPQIQACSIGSSVCNGVDLVNDLSPAVSPLIPKLYIYSQGIISFDDPLSGSPANLSGAAYFSPGYSPNANYQVAVVETNSYDAYGTYGLAVNFYAPNTSVTLPNQFGNAGTTPLFQFIYEPQVDPTTGDTTSAQVDFYYPSDPAANALIGYSGYSSSNGYALSSQLVYNNHGLDLGRSDFGITVTPDASSPDGITLSPSDTLLASYKIVYDTGALTVSAAPEPSSWALMIVGLGLVGAWIRRSEPQRALA